MKAKLHTVFVFSILISNIVLFSQVSAQEHLAASDGKLNQVYKQLMERLNGSQKQQLKLDQREWIKKRDAMVKSSPNNPQGALDFATQQRVLVLSQLLDRSGFHEQRTFTQAEASLDANGLYDQGYKYFLRGDFAKAEIMYEHALSIYEKTLGPQHPNVAIALNGLGSTYSAMGNYAKALPLRERALRIQEKALGPEHPDIAKGLNNLATIYRFIGNYHKALPLQERALATHEKALGPEHPNTAKSLNELATTYGALGEFAKALPLQERALWIHEKALGLEHSDTAKSLNDLAVTHVAMGNYSKAFPLQERALAIREKALGPEHRDTAASLISLAATYQSMGNHAKALPLEERALAICEKALGPEHPNTAQVLNGLATIYQSMGNYSKALPLRERALRIQEKALGPEHPDTAEALNNLATTYLAMESYEKALPLEERALRIQEKALGPEHPNTAEHFSKLATIYRDMGSYERALPLEERALRIQEKALGPEHPDTLLTCRHIAEIHFLSGSALPLIRNPLARVYSGKEKSLENILTLDEKTRLAWQQKNLDLPMIDLLRIEQRCQFILRTKGVILDSLLEDQVGLKQLGENTWEQTELTTARLRLGKLAFSNKKEDQDEAARLKARIDSILTSAAGQRVKIGRVRESATITPDTVAAALPKEGMLVEFIQFTDPKIKGDKGRCYGALILGLDGESKFVRIDVAASLDASVQALREAIVKGDEKALVDQQMILSEKLWEPIAKNLPEGVKKLFIGADGQLNFLSFAALPMSDGSFLVEHYDIAYVGSGRDLARKVSPSESKTIALFADPVFDRQASVFSTNALAMRSGELDAFGQIMLSPLPGTKAEDDAVEEVAKAAGWTPEARLGEAANKSAIMDLKSPGILHLATHGFYLNTLSVNGAEGERGMKVMESADSRKQAPPPKIDPMHASGIALTGAQATLKAWSKGRVPDPKEDGILTAEEVGALNLDGTWLVTLSACETGVGAARSGEGVFGLRRAFMIAGAQNLLMTLWPVSDDVTPKIMADFYKEALKTGDAAGSLAKVQREWLVKLRDEKGLLAAVRDAGPFAIVVMAKQNSTFSSPSTATPIASPQTKAGPLSPSVPVPTPAPPEPAQPVPSSSPAPSLTPGPEASPSATPGTSPNQTPSPEASPSETPVLSELVEFKKAA